MRRSLIPDVFVLQTFECAARHGNFTRAAEELNLTQSAVSRQIRELEAQTGVQLFERSRQRVTLSEAGARFLPEVQQLLGQAERMMVGAMAAGQNRHPLRVATLPTFGMRWLVPRLHGFCQASPEIALTLESRGEPFSFDAENFDLAIHYGQENWPGAKSLFLCNEAVVPVAAPSVSAILWRGQGLEKAPRLHLTTRPRLWQDWFDHEGLGAEDGYNGIRFDQFAMIISAAVAGMGVALVPTYLIEDELARGTLVALSDYRMPTAFSYYIMRPESRPPSKAVLAFQTWLLAQVPPRGRGAQPREG